MRMPALHDYEDAVQHFEIAASDAKYDAKYRAYTGMGNAYLKLGKSAEAGAAFRSAALDEANPEPTKALLNLGICFMALNRPNDAVTSYENALQFDMPAATRNKLCANLGQAYVASGQMQKAVSAFESALADKTYFLSDSASVDYQRAIAQVSTGTAELTPVDVAGTDTSGLDVAADGSPLDSRALRSRLRLSTRTTTRKSTKRLRSTAMLRATTASSTRAMKSSNAGRRASQSASASVATSA